MMENRVDLMFCASLALIMLGMSCNSMVLAQPTCTPQTCPPDTPVMAYFEHSNCTGNIQYIAVPVPVGTCQNETIASIEYFVNDETVGYRMFQFSDDCGATDQGAAYMGIYYWFGVCAFAGSSVRDAFNSPLLSGFARDGLAAPYQYVMYLRHVNASYEAPQEPVPIDMSYPSYEESVVEEACYSTNNCTFNGEEAMAWSTSYTNSTCALDGAESSMIANITAGECYRYIFSYVRNRCITEHTYAMDLMVGHGCEHAFLSQVHHASCGTSSNVNLRCPLPASPVNEPVATPTSAAPILGLTSISLALITLILTTISN